jgi:hypothetical protein
MKLEKFMNDQVTVKTMEGKTYTNIAALVQSDKILTSRADIPIRPGDQIIRVTPAGVEEVFIVEDPGFCSGLRGIPAHYQMRVRRAPATATKNIVMATPETVYSKALRLLQAIYEHTHGSEEPVFVLEKINSEIGLSEDDAKAAWRYLRDKNLIDTFSIDYMARINAYGIDTIETARLHPDEPAKNFPSVTYNNINIQNMIGSTIQQGGAHANITKREK